MNAPAQQPLKKRKDAGAIALRTILYAQIAWTAFVGLLCRGVIPFPRAAPRWFEMAFSYVMMFAFLAFPLAVIVSLFRWRQPDWKVCVLLAIEAGFTWANYLAILPAVS